MLNCTVGKLPGFAREIIVPEGTTVLEAMRQGIREETESRDLDYPVAEVFVGDYRVKGQNTVDVPQVNGVHLADFDTASRRYENIRWDTPVQDGDLIFVLPKEQGAQIIVEVRVDGCTPRKVAVYHPGEPEGGAEAGTVSQALSAAGVRLGQNDHVYVNGEVSALETELEEGDEILIAAGEYQFLEGAEIAPTEDEILSITGTDPGELQAEAEELQAKAYAAKAEAEVKMAEARELAGDAKAYAAKADAILEATDKYSSGLRRLEELGVEIEVPTVFVGTLAGVETIEFIDGMTVGDLELPELDGPATVLRNGQPIDGNEPVESGDTILVVPTTKNGRWIKTLIAE